MAYRVEVTVRAARDLAWLYATINAANAPQAHAWFNGLETLILSLGEHPHRGRMTHPKSTTRRLLYRSKSYSYHVFYQISARHGTVYILHIRHASRKATGLA